VNDAHKPVSGTGLCKWAERLGVTGLVVTVIGILGAAWSMFGPFPAMLSMALGSLLLIIGAVLAVIGLVRSRGTAGEASYPLTIAALVAGSAALLNAVVFIGSGGGPAIHDISTDTMSPPEFVAVVELRGPTDNPAEYSGADTAKQQQEAYPDIETIVLRDPRSLVFDSALTVAGDMGWEIVDSDTAEGRIEATATTPWVGFKDDVVIRIRTRSAETLVDVRSKSRVGRGDMGVNAKRIRKFRDRLIAALEP
jgi:uncharacterized protein (DUF1499 family)